jgi:hypothetical protein
MQGKLWVALAKPSFIRFGKSCGQGTQVQSFTQPEVGVIFNAYCKVGKLRISSDVSQVGAAL